MLHHIYSCATAFGYLRARLRIRTLSSLLHHFTNFQLKFLFSSARFRGDERALRSNRLQMISAIEDRVVIGATRVGRRISSITCRHR